MPPPDLSTPPSHADDETLALLALGEHVDPWVSEHVASCVQCREDVHSFARVVLAGQALEPADETLVAPPPAIWAAIVAELGLGAVGTAAPAGAARPADTTAAADRYQPPSTSGGATVTPLRRSTPRTAVLLLAASVVGALVGIGALAGYQALSDEPDIVATAELDPVDPDFETVGEAELTGVGQDRELDLQLDVEPPPGSYLQVWLMSTDTEHVVPVGVLEDGVGFWRVPADLDLSAYPLVDVSVEPLDGNEAHSGESLVRGPLDAA